MAAVMTAERMINPYDRLPLPLWLAILMAIWVALCSIPYPYYFIVGVRVWLKKRRELREYYASTEAVDKKHDESG